LVNSPTKIVPANSILFVSRVGVGKIAVSDVEICTSQDFCNFTPYSDNAAFIAYWMSGHKQKLLSLSQGTSIKGLTSADLKGIHISLPHPAEQKRIADFLAAIDGKIDAVSDQATAMQRFKQGLMQQMFV
jgi:type I restriction enzyme S subunit